MGVNRDDAVKNARVTSHVNSNSKRKRTGRIVNLQIQHCRRGIHLVLFGESLGVLRRMARRVKTATTRRLAIAEARFFTALLCGDGGHHRMICQGCLVRFLTDRRPAETG